MNVRDDRAGLADPAGDITAGTPPRPRFPAPELSAGAADLPGFLRATARLGDLDELATASAACDAAIAAVTPASSPPAPAAATPSAGAADSVLGALYSLRSSLARRRGDLRTAKRDGEAAAGLLGRGDALLVARRISVLLDIGDVAGADLLLNGFGDDLPDGPGAVALRYARGRLHAAAGRPGEGLADLFYCGERLAARQADSPSVLPWRSAAARVLAATGATESAARLVAAEVAVNRRSGTPSALGRSLRVQGMVLDGPAGLAVLAEAFRLLARSPRRFEYAGLLVDFGVRLNAVRRRPQARRVLREGMELAGECGSPALVARARTGYAAAGGKLRPGLDG
jgi:hypothetical protein